MLSDRLVRSGTNWWSVLSVMLKLLPIKGPPVTPLNEIMIMVSAVKWVDEVIPDALYATTEDFMKKLSDEYNIYHIIHGDDPCILPDGTDAYALAKKAWSLQADQAHRRSAKH